MEMKEQMKKLVAGNWQNASVLYLYWNAKCTLQWCYHNPNMMTNLLIISKLTWTSSPGGLTRAVRPDGICCLSSIPLPEILIPTFCILMIFL